MKLSDYTRWHALKAKHNLSDVEAAEYATLIARL